MGGVVGRRASSGLALAVAFGATVLGACSLYVESSRVQCETDADCADRGAAFADTECIDSVCRPPAVEPAWSCLGNVDWPQPPAQLVSLSMPIVDLVTGSAISGVTVRACEKLDVACSVPLTSDVVSDGAGMIVLGVPAGFDGYLELQSAATQPALLFIYPPVLQDSTIPPLPLFNPQSFGDVLQASGNTALPDHGHVFLGARNCVGEPAAGVSFSSYDLGPDGALFYMIADLPSATAPATDVSGRAAFINVDTGFVVVTGTRQETLSRVGEVSLLVRAGAITYSSLVPSP